MPARTPAPIISKMHNAFSESLRKPEVLEKLTSQCLVLKTSSPQEFQKFLENEVKRWNRVVKDNKILLVRRAQNPGKGYWTNPGGYIEQLEPIEATIVREVEEEAGIQAAVKRVVALRDLDIG